MNWKYNFKFLVVILTFFVLICGASAYVTQCAGFSFKITNNLDDMMHYLLFYITPQGPFNIFGGEIAGKSEWKSAGDGWGAGYYYVVWADPMSEWSSRRDFEVDESVKRESTVEVSLNYVPIEVYLVE